jgi:hypothetical protein
MTVICAKLPYEVAPPKDSSRRKADLVCCRATGAALPDVKLSRETEVLSGPRSQPSGDQNRLPEKHAKKYNNKDAKDKAPPIGIERVIVLGGQPFGIAHVETNWTPASKLSLTPDC